MENQSTWIESCITMGSTGFSISSVSSLPCAVQSVNNVQSLSQSADLEVFIFPSGGDCHCNVQRMISLKEITGFVFISGNFESIYWKTSISSSRVTFGNFFCTNCVLREIFREKINHNASICMLSSAPLLKMFFVCFFSVSFNKHPDFHVACHSLTR